MADNLKDYMCKFVQQKSELLKGCLIAVLDNPLQYLSLLEVSLGTPTLSTDVKYCELLTDAGLLREETKLTRDGRNRYRVFYLTETGKEIAKRIKEQGYNGSIPQSTPLNNI